MDAAPRPKRCRGNGLLRVGRVPQQARTDGDGELLLGGRRPRSGLLLLRERTSISRMATPWKNFINVAIQNTAEDLHLFHPQTLAQKYNIQIQRLL